MNTAALEAFLARLYTDETLRERFLSNPHAETQRAGLDEEACAALLRIDRVGLELAARSLTRKREKREHLEQHHKR